VESYHFARESAVSRIPDNASEVPKAGCARRTHSGQMDFQKADAELLFERCAVNSLQGV
jgi:hypothetical protein